MPDKATHLAIAKHNRSVIAYLQAHPTGLPGWTATVAFYTAVHLVEALLAADFKNALHAHSGNHDERDGLLKTTKRYQKIWKNFRPMKSVSEQARYMKAPGYFTAEFVDETILGHHLKQVIGSVEKLIGEKIG